MDNRKNVQMRTQDSRDSRHARNTKESRGILDLLNRCEDFLVLVFCLGMFLVGAYGLYDSFMVYHQANDDSILRYKPGYEGEAPEKEIQGNMVAWLTLEGTGIDYPVMQGDNNFEYLNTNPYGEYSLSGSVFLDCRNAGDFSDSYSLLYGHHMENGYMFGALDRYRKEAFFREHETGTLTVGDRKREIRIIAVLEAMATDEVIFSAGRDVCDDQTVGGGRESAGLDRKTEDILKKIEETAIFSRYYEGKPLIAFSTCRYPDTAERTIVIGELEK